MATSGLWAIAVSRGTTILLGRTSFDILRTGISFPPLRHWTSPPRMTKSYSFLNCLAWHASFPSMVHQMFQIYGKLNIHKEPLISCMTLGRSGIVWPGFDHLNGSFRDSTCMEENMHDKRCNAWRINRSRLYYLELVSETYLQENVVPRGRTWMYKNAMARNAPGYPL